MSAERKALWKRKLDESRTALFQLLNSLSTEQWQTTVFAEGDTWTVATVLAHLVESERGMSIHVHKIRKGEATIADRFRPGALECRPHAANGGCRARRTDGQCGRHPRQNAGGDGLSR